MGNYKAEDGLLQMGRWAVTARRWVAINGRRATTNSKGSAVNRQPPPPSHPAQLQMTCISCPICSFAYAQSNILNHLRKNHADIPVSQDAAGLCGLVACHCGQVASNSVGLKRHQGIWRCQPVYTTNSHAPAQERTGPPSVEAAPAEEQYQQDQCADRVRVRVRCPSQQWVNLFDASRPPWETVHLKFQKTVQYNLNSHLRRVCIHLEDGPLQV